MNVQCLIPLLSVIGYLSLFAILAANRPWQRQHKLLIWFLISAVLWAISTFFLRGNLFLEHKLLLFRVVICASVWLQVQLYYFLRSTINQPGGFGVRFGYGLLIALVTLAALGYIPENVTFDSGTVSPIFGWWIILYSTPLVLLTGLIVYSLARKFRASSSLQERNKIALLLSGVGIFVLLAGIGITPLAHLIPVSHIGGVIFALILTYAVVRHELVSVTFVLRRGLGWVSVGIVGIAVYLLLFLGLKTLLDFPLNPVTLTVEAGVALLVVILVYKMRGFFFEKVGKAFQRQTYDYRQKLLNFVSRVHNVFSLRELGGELLPLVIKAINCKRACLLFPEGESGDFTPNFIEPQGEDNPLSSLRMRQDNPIVQYLRQRRGLLSIEILDILPEFHSLWEQERGEIKAAEIELFMPVISRGKLVSILALSKKQSGSYLLEDINLLEDITSRVAVSIEKGYLHEQVRQREEELSLISHLATIMTSGLDIQEIYGGFIKELKKVMDVDWSAIALIEGDEIYMLALSSEMDSPWQPGDRISIKGTATEWVVTNKRALAESDLSQESRFWTDKYFLRQGVRSVVRLPLLVKDKAIGSLVIASCRPNAYSRSQIQLLSQLASQIATPIENSRLYAQAERRARLDELTGLWNRRHLEERVQIEIGRHSRYGGAFSIIILDLDSFKAFNDSYGHLAGDKLLRQLGSILRSAIRSADEAFRYGGDEFAILLPQTSVKDAHEVAERVRSRIASEIKTSHTSVTASLGLASWPVNGIGINEIITAADTALYYAKQSGGNQSHAISEILPPLAEPATKKPEVQQDKGALSIVYALAAAVDTKDLYAHNHSQQVQEYAVALAKSLDLEPGDITRLSTCALLHDIGKIDISGEILNKTSKLDTKEWEVIKSHSQLGAGIISHIPQLASCLPGILHHHERYDGSGYPSGLKGEAIPLDARILGIADAFAAMTSAHAYRDALSYEEALEELKRGAGKQFDPNLVEAFLSAARTIPLFATQ